MLCTKKLNIVKTTQNVQLSARFMAVTPKSYINHGCKLLVVGGGAGGCTMAAKFAKSFKKKTDVTLVDSATNHYYQPMFTLVGGGIKSLKDSARSMQDVLPKNVTWLKTNVVEFNPKENSVRTENGDTINYDYMIVAMGLQVNYDQIPGLLEGLKLPGGVCSNYSPLYVERTYQALRNFKEGNLIFTFPNSPVKCPGAPQKIMYIAEHFLRKKGLRKKAKIFYNTSLPVIFGVPRYADALWDIVKDRDINVNLRTNLTSVDPTKNEATFENLDSGETTTMQYAILHVTPPMSAPDVLKGSKELTNELGFLEVNKDTLQHVKYQNIFGIGDCTNSPNSKTAASVAAQSGVVYCNLKSVMKGQRPSEVYNGYASCPLVTGYSSCILAEFDYNLTPRETFPFSQAKERLSMYLMKKDMMPALYWQLMLNGMWNGPEIFRKIMHPFQRDK